MRAFKPTLVALFLSSVAFAADPTSPFTFPTAPPAPTPPAPAPGAVPVLAGEMLYVVGSKTDAIARPHPAGLVKVTKESGPIKIRGKFIDGTGGVETRTYNTPFVFIVEPVAKGRVEIDFIPLGLKTEGEIGFAVIDVGEGTAPIPPPKPKPDPDPPSPVVKVDSVWVIVVEDAVPPRTVETAKMLNDPYWLTLKPKNEWRHYLSTSTTAINNGYVESAKKVGYPAVLILNAKDGDLLKSFRSTSIAEIESAVKGLVKP